jgi:pterin-4a-carbinolamine dehydratase
MYEYKFVQVATTTHDSWNTITAKDISLAEKIELSYTI